MVIMNPVLPLDYTNKAPVFPDQDPDTSGSQTAQEREVNEDARAGFDLGAKVEATDLGSDGRTQETLTYQLEESGGTVLTDQDDFVN